MRTVNVIEGIFFAALEKKTPADRKAYLDEACVGDVELRQCVERMLDAQPKLGEFLQATTPPAPVEPPPIEERPGTIIGPYKLLQQLGEGGFGVVFMAEQEHPVRRKVALKIIKPGMDSKQVVARFEAERQALAIMDHPNISRVLDGGTTDSGRPFFVMELVKGIPITEFCDKNRLTPRERLELFIPVCAAVQHAHQKGIIHRDIKPSNVLVTMYDDKPVPKVIDFGVAKAIEQKLTEQTLFTRVGQVIGTLEYMSPEQASLNALDVDTRADVYALGVLLYELLTGTTPLNKEKMEGVAFLEMLRLIREVDPPKPSTRLSQSGDALSSYAVDRRTDSQKLPKLVKGELDWIAMKALEKDRTRRYETANALAADVQRYLNDEIVEARPPLVGYRLQKYARRHKGELVAASVVLTVLMCGIIGTSWGMMDAGKERDNAVANKIEADKEKLNADVARNKMEDAFKETIGVNNKLLDEQNRIQHMLYITQFTNAQAALDERRIPRLMQLLQDAIPKHGAKDLRGWEWHYLNRLIHRGVERVVTVKNTQKEDGTFVASKITADGRSQVRYYYSEKEGVSFRWFDSKAESRVPKDGWLANYYVPPAKDGKRYAIPPSGLAIDPEGKYFGLEWVYPPENDQPPRRAIRIWDAHSGEELTIKDNEVPAGAGVGLLGDYQEYPVVTRYRTGYESLVIGPNAAWAAWDVTPPRDQREEEDGGDQDRKIAIRQWNKKSGVTTLKEFTGRGIGCLDETTVVCHSKGGEEFWDVTREKPQLRFTVPENSIIHCTKDIVVEWDRTQLIARSVKSNGKELWRRPFFGDTGPEGDGAKKDKGFKEIPLRIPRRGPLMGPRRDIRFSPASTMAAAWDGEKITVWSATDGEPQWEAPFVRPPADFVPVGVSDDGTRVLFQDLNRFTVLEMMTATKAREFNFLHQYGKPVDAKFSADGRTIEFGKGNIVRMGGGGSNTTITVTLDVARDQLYLRAPIHVRLDRGTPEYIGFEKTEAANAKRTGNLSVERPAQTLMTPVGSIFQIEKNPWTLRDANGDQLVGLQLPRVGAVVLDAGGKRLLVNQDARLTPVSFVAKNAASRTWVLYEIDWPTGLNRIAAGAGTANFIANSQRILVQKADSRKKSPTGGGPGGGALAVPEWAVLEIDGPKPSTLGGGKGYARVIPGTQRLLVGINQLSSGPAPKRTGPPSWELHAIDGPKVRRIEQGEGSATAAPHTKRFLVNKSVVPKDDDTQKPTHEWALYDVDRPEEPRIIKTGAGAAGFLSNDTFLVADGPETVTFRAPKATGPTESGEVLGVSLTGLYVVAPRAVHKTESGELLYSIDTTPGTLVHLQRWTNERFHLREYKLPKTLPKPEPGPETKKAAPVSPAIWAAEMNLRTMDMATGKELGAAKFDRLPGSNLHVLEFTKDRKRMFLTYDTDAGGKLWIGDANGNTERIVPLPVSPEGVLATRTASFGPGASGRSGFFLNDDQSTLFLNYRTKEEAGVWICRLADGHTQRKTFVQPLVSLKTPQLPVGGGGKLAGAAYAESTFTIGADGKRVYLMGPTKDGFAIWVGRASDGATEHNAALPFSQVAVSNLQILGSAPNGNLVTAFLNEVMIWDLDKGKLVHQLRRHEGGVRAAEFSPDGTRLFVLEEGRATGKTGADGLPLVKSSQLRVWDLATERELLILPVPNDLETRNVGGKAKGGARMVLQDAFRLSDGRLYFAEEGGIRILDGSPAAK